MYAVIETSGKQYRVELGTTLEVDRLEAEPGTTLTIDRVLLVADGDTAEIGRPLVANATVSADVVGDAKGDKITVFKYRPKARRRVKKGHRAQLTVLRITDITLDGRSAASEAAKQAEAQKTERQRLADAAAKQAAADAELAKKLAARTATTEEAPKSRSRSRTKAAAAEPTSDEAAPAEEAKPRRRAAPKATEAPAEAPGEEAAAEAAADVAPEAPAEPPAEETAAEAAAETEKPKRTRRPKATTED